MHEYIQQVGHVPLHLAGAVNAVLNVTYVAGMGRVAMCALCATPRAPLQFLAALGIHDNIITYRRKIFVLGDLRRFSMCARAVERGRCCNVLLLWTSACVYIIHISSFVACTFLRCMKQKSDRDRMITSISRRYNCALRWRMYIRPYIATHIYPHCVPAT